MLEIMHNRLGLISGFDFEKATQKSLQCLWRFPDYNLHKQNPFQTSESAAGTSAGNQQKCHEKQQCTHWKNGRNQNPCPQRYRKDPQNPIPASSKHSSHTLSLLQYIHETPVWKPESRRQCRRLSNYFFRFLTSHSCSGFSSSYRRR